MTKLAVGALCTLLLAAPGARAQESKPATAATPLQIAQPKAPKAKVYDEQADAKQQIAAALAKAKKDNRRVLLQWGGNWCPWCLKLDELCKKDKDLSKELLYEYDVVHVDAGQNGKNMDLAKSYGADCAKEGFPYLTILDADGKVLVNQGTPAFEVDSKKLEAGHDAKKLLEFLTKHQAAPLNAQTILDNGFSEAKRTGKRVFLHFGAPWCGWCHRLEDWMARPEVAAILAKDFVDVKIDVDRNTSGAEIKSKYTGGKEGGIPWFVFLDDAGKTLATSDGAKGNVGFPYQKEEVGHFVEMVKRAAIKLTPADIDALAASLNANREAEEKKAEKH